MEREQIIKALECCLSWGGCYDCPLSFEGDLTRDCKIDMLKDALALIKELTEENKKLGIENFDLICELSRIKADTVREMQTRISMHFGTYTDKTDVKVAEVFKLLSKIEEDILNETEDDLK